MGVPAAQGGMGPPIIPAPKAKPRPIISARGNVGASQPHGTAKLAPPSGLLAGIGHAIGNIGASSQQAATSATTQHTSGRPGGDVQSGGYSNFAQADQFRNSPAYKAAIMQVFRSQSTSQKAAIIQGLVRQNAFAKLPEYQAVRSVWDHLPTSEMSAIPSLIPHDIGKFISPHTGNLGSVLKSGVDAIGNVLKAGAGDYGGKGSTSGSGALAAATPFSKNTLGRQLVVNAGKDAVNLPAEAFATGGTVVNDFLRFHQNPGVGAVDNSSSNASKAINDVVGPYTHLDPIKHPLDTYLMLAGPVHGATRAASTAARAVAPESALARAGAPTVPPSVQLTGNLTHERPAFSRYPLIKGAQILNQKRKFEPAPGGGLKPRSENLRARLTKQEVSRSLVGARERIRRAGVQLQVQAHGEKVLASRPARVAHGVKTALSYNPGSALIHGANILSLIADHTIRTKATLFKDLQKHLSDVQSRRSSLEGMPEALKDHNAYVAHLQAALKDKGLRDPKNVNRLFDAAHQYATDVQPLQREAFAHDHYAPGMTQEGLLRRELQPVVLSHYPGARLDPELGMVADTAHGTRKLSTQEMVAFDKQQTGGRPLAYTSHAAPRGDSAFYANQQKYPARAVQRNSGFAYQHGLRDPTHEALLQHRVELENAIDAHRSQDKILSTTVLRGKDVPGSSTVGFWKTGNDAKIDAPPGYVPIRVGRMTAKGEGAAPTVENLSHEANLRSLDLNERLRATDEAGQWGLIDKNVLDQLNKHQAQISPNTFMRALRSTTTQFRKVALGTSVRHLPGVAAEGLIRDIGAGVFVQHLASGKNVFAAMKDLDPRSANEVEAGVPREHAAERLMRERQTELGGGMIAGMTRAMATRQGARHFEGTVLYKPMKAFEAFTKAPGPRQLGTAWNAWTHVVIDGTKKVIEQNQQTAGLGKALHVQLGRVMTLQGKAAQEAARGLLSDKTVRQLRSEIQRTFGLWTDMTPSGQTAMMYSPFGMWWVNSVRWLGRMPIDQPVKTGLLASATIGTEKQRQAEGLDMFAPNALPGYLQGSIPSGNKLIGQQYYSPFGVAGDPAGTGASLMEPTFMPFVLALLGDNYLGRSLRSPSDPHGHTVPNQGERILVALNSVLSNFVPLYTKVQTVRQGGASAFDTSTQFNIQTKGQNGGLAKGLEKAFQPLRLYPKPANKGSAPSSGSGWGGGTSSGSSSSGGSSSGGWGGSTSSGKSSGGWGG